MSLLGLLSFPLGLHFPLPRHEAAAPPPRLSRRLLLAGVAAATPPRLSASASPDGDRAIQDAYAAFTRGDYLLSEKLWLRASEESPASALVWQNLASVLVINASDEMKLGELPRGEALRRLQRALHAAERARDLGSADALLANARGNALGLLQQWVEAHAAYEEAVRLSPRDFESIPLSNCALTSFELRQDEQAEREALRLTRRDPTFVDGFALLATLRHSRGDESGAANAFRVVCSDAQWCSRYSTDDVVLGRWTPRAVKEFRELLRSPSVQDVRAASALR
ncbi:hypothetical protein AB1Y20_006094 [Prymnesium parvum]|uniref:Uncharacterized protein n=1 Tax=Prymnesium parvum TaxID=97485 RepID=A0AB34J466_PRYPA